MENEPIKKQQDLTWLEDLQKNSWEPEVIITGISLAFLFVIPSKLFHYIVALIQDYGLEEIPGVLILTYFSMVISVIKVFLIIHLILRFVWAGMLGITYAFPEGVVKEKLFKYSQDIEYHQPNTYLLNLERWCSMMFGIPISFAIPLLSMTCYLVLLIGIYLVFGLEFQVVYVIFMVSLLVLSFGSFMGKKSAIKNWVGQSMSGTIGAVYQSNLGKWRFMGFLFSLFFLATPFVIQDLDGFYSYESLTNLGDSNYEWPEDRAYFEEYNQDGIRFPRVWTESKTIEGDYFNLYLVRYERDQMNLSKLNEQIQVNDTLSWKNLKSISDQYLVYLDDSLIEVEKWNQAQAGPAGQKSFFAPVPVGNLSPGVHEVRLEKLVYVPPFLFKDAGLRHRKKWARFLIVKN